MNSQQLPMLVVKHKKHLDYAYLLCIQYRFLLKNYSNGGFFIHCEFREDRDDVFDDDDDTITADSMRLR